MRAGFGRSCDDCSFRLGRKGNAILPRISIGAHCSLFGGRRFATDVGCPQFYRCRAVRSGGTEVVIVLTETGMLDHQIRLLVSDETREFGLLVRDCATRLGWECVLSPDLPSFISGVSSNRFDLVCMQMVHPEVDGLGAIHVLRDVGFSGKVLMFNHSTELYSRVADNLSAAHGFSLTNYRWPLDPVHIEQALVQAIAA